MEAWPYSVVARVRAYEEGEINPVFRLIGRRRRRPAAGEQQYVRVRISSQHAAICAAAVGQRRAGGLCVRPVCARGWPMCAVGLAVGLAGRTMLFSPKLLFVDFQMQCFVFAWY